MFSFSILNLILQEYEANLMGEQHSLYLIKINSEKEEEKKDLSSTR